MHGAEAVVADFGTYKPIAGFASASRSTGGIGLAGGAGARGDRPVSVAYFVVSGRTAPWPLFTVVSTFTDVSRLTIVVSRVILGVITVSLEVPTRSVCP
jgi:hypothetical protein